MAKKYFVSQLDPESFNYDMYYNEDQAICDKFWAGGNPDCGELNASLIKELPDNLIGAANDMKVVEDNAEEYGISEEEKQKEFDVIIRYFLEPNGVVLSAEAVNKLVELAKEAHETYYDLSGVEQDSFLCKVLEARYGEPFKTGVLTGYCQGDYLYYICPERLTAEYIDYIEAVLFATGTEFEVTCDMYDEENTFEKVAELAEGDAYNIYTKEWQKDKVIKDLARQIGCAESEIKVQVIKDIQRINKYIYEAL